MAIIGYITVQHFLDGEVFKLYEKQFELEKLLRREQQLINELERIPGRVTALNEELANIRQMIEVTHGRETGNETGSGYLR